MAARPTRPTHAVVMAAPRDRDQLRELSIAEDLAVLRLLTDRCDELSRSRAQGLNRLHRLMTELVPGGIPRKKSVPQYQTMLARVRPRDVVGRTVRRLAADQLADLVRLDRLPARAESSHTGGLCQHRSTRVRIVSNAIKADFLPM